MGIRFRRGPRIRGGLPYNFGLQESAPTRRANKSTRTRPIRIPRSCVLEGWLSPGRSSEQQPKQQWQHYATAYTARGRQRGGEGGGIASRGTFMMQYMIDEEPRLSIFWRRHVCHYNSSTYVAFDIARGASASANSTVLLLIPPNQQLPLKALGHGGCCCVFWLGRRQLAKRAIN